MANNTIYIVIMLSLEYAIANKNFLMSQIMFIAYYCANVDHSEKPLPDLLYS